MVFADFHFAHVSPSEHEARVWAADTLDNGGDADSMHVPEHRLPTDALFSVLADIIEDATRRSRGRSIQLCLGRQRVALIVVGNHEGRKAACHIDRARGNGLAGSYSLFEPRYQVAGKLDLRIVGSLAENLLWNDGKSKPKAGREGREHEGVEQ